MQHQRITMPVEMGEYEKSLRTKYTGVKKRLINPVKRILPAIKKVPLPLPPPKWKCRDWMVVTKPKNQINGTGLATLTNVSGEMIECLTHELVNKILISVSYDHGVSVMDLKSKRRDKITVKARQVAIRQIKEKTMMSLTRIGNVFNRDRTTILHALRTLKRNQNETVIN